MITFGFLKSTSVAGIVRAIDRLAPAQRLLVTLVLSPKEKEQLWHRFVETATLDDLGKEGWQLLALLFHSLETSRIVTGPFAAQLRAAYCQAWSRYELLLPELNEINRSFTEIGCNEPIWVELGRCLMYPEPCLRQLHLVTGLIDRSTLRLSKARLAGALSRWRENPRCRVFIRRDQIQIVFRQTNVFLRLLDPGCLESLRRMRCRLDSPSRSRMKDCDFLVLQPEDLCLMSLMEETNAESLPRVVDTVMALAHLARVDRISALSLKAQALRLQLDPVWSSAAGLFPPGSAIGARVERAGAV